MELLLAKPRLVLKVCVVSCFLLLQGSLAASSVSTSSSVVPALAPNAEETTQIYNANTSPRNVPCSISPMSGTMSYHMVGPGPVNYVPGPQMISPALLPNAPISIPPSSSTRFPRISPGSVQVSPLSNDQIDRPQSPDHYVVAPETSVSSISPYSSAVPALAPNAEEPTGNILKGKLFPSVAPSSTSQEDGRVPVSPPSNHQFERPQSPESPVIVPETPEPITPVLRPSSQKSPTYGPLVPSLLAPAPSAQEGGEDFNAPPPLPHPKSAQISGSESPSPIPSTDAQRHHYPIDRTTAPASTMKGVPPPIPHHESDPNFRSRPPGSVPSTTPQRHRYPIDRATSPASQVNGVPHPMVAPHPELHPPSSSPTTTTPSHHHPRYKTISPTSSISGVPQASPEEGAELVHPKTDFRHHASPPLRSEEHHSPAVAPSVFPAPPPRTTTMPLPPPKASHPRSLPKFPKMPVQLIPPPPPDEDCATVTCSEPLTNGPPGPPCLCVLPILVGLRLSVALYTFFPLVSELAAEISSGVLLQQSQVRVMGANEATQDPEKTIVLINLVPLGKTFDRTTAYSIFRRFWHKQVDIRAALFSDYEVLYVHYPGLPPSPPSASPDIESIHNDPYHNHYNNSWTMKPLGVDVSRIRHNKGPNRSVIAIIVLSASLALILSCVLVWLFLFKNRGSVSRPSERIPPGDVVKSGLASVGGSEPSSMSVSSGIAGYTGSAKTFSSSELERATSNFNEMRVLGEGGFGRVYSGVLDDGTQVAVKVLKRDDHQGGREFLAEVEMLSRLHHRNLLKLIGICIEERARSLVYELIPNGSVESHLHGVDKETAPLDWSSRLKIALGSARGLAYLHEDSSPRVIHRDFKASNILLEDDFTPKVSDFGLARIALDENRHISTRVMGTFGYVAPEYAMTGHLLVKSDVYSYGVVLLELLTGRKPGDMSQPPGEENLVSWARPLLTSKEGLEVMVDQSLGPDFPFDSITKVAAIASMCVQPEVSNRPFMGEVVQALKLIYNECSRIQKMQPGRYIYLYGSCSSSLQSIRGIS